MAASRPLALSASGIPYQYGLVRSTLVRSTLATDLPEGLEICEGTPPAHFGGRRLPQF